jgi:hypothetical protein
VSLHTTAAERAIHLALFVAAGAALAVVVLGALERVLDRTTEPTIRLWHMTIPVAVFVASFIAERLYHALS